MSNRPEVTTKHYNTEQRALPDEENKVVVFYHGPGCADGFAAAWVVHHMLNTLDSVPTMATYIPVGYENQYDVYEAHRKLLEDAAVYVVDFTFRPDILAGMLHDGADYLMVLDHHATSENAVEMFRGDTKGRDDVSLTFDMQRSGAVIAWETLIGESAPLLLQHIQDRDLWNWAMPHTKEVMDGLFIRDWTFELFDALFHRGIEALTELVADGNLVRIVRDGDHANIMREAQVETGLDVLHGINAVAVNCPYFLVSETCHKLLEAYPDKQVAVGYFITRDGNVKCSARSRKGTKYARLLAERFGGGGHDTAAGFTVNTEQF